MRRAAHRIAAVACLLLSIACARGMRVPVEFKNHQPAELYTETFKPIGNIQVSGTALIGGTTFSDIKRCDFTFFAVQPDQSRLFLSNESKGSLLDIIRRGLLLTVVAEQTGYVYQGEIPAESSPFTRSWGFEPGEIHHALTVGRSLVADTTEEGNVEFQTAHGIPELVRWRRGEQELIARYFAWDYVANATAADTADKRLIPTKFQIACPATGVFMTLTVRNATFDQPVQEALFTPALNYKARRATLQNLETALAPR